MMCNVMEREGDFFFSFGLKTSSSSYVFTSSSFVKVQDDWEINGLGLVPFTYI